MREVTLKLPKEISKGLLKITREMDETLSETILRSFALIIVAHQESENGNGIAIIDRKEEYIINKLNCFYKKKKVKGIINE